MGQRELARWMKGIDLVALVCCLGVLVAIVPGRCAAIAAARPDLAAMVAAGWAFVALAAVPIIAIAALAWRIFSAIAADDSSSNANAARLRTLGIFAVAEAVLVAACIVALAAVNAMADGLLAVMLVATVASGGLGAVAMALSHLTAKAAAIKAENDLTV